MPGFVMTCVFEVAGGKQPLGADVLARGWGSGHRFSYCDGRMLTVVAEVTAPDVSVAFESVLGRAETVWQALGFGVLGRAVTVRVQAAVEPERVPAGAPTAVPPSAEVAREPRRPAARPGDGPRMIGQDDEEPPDDGGLAGVREPRRPRPAPPTAGAARPLPGTGPLGLFAEGAW